MGCARLPGDVLAYDYTAPLTTAYDLAVELREAGINIVVVIGLDKDANRLWRAMQQADANVTAWIQIRGKQLPPQYLQPPGQHRRPDFDQHDRQRQRRLLHEAG